MIDGISTTSAVWGGTTVITPSEDSVANVRVLSNGYDAEYGRFSGAQIQITSKSGSDHFHGSGFFTMHRPGFNAYQPFNGNDIKVQKDPYFFDADELVSTTTFSPPDFRRQHAISLLRDSCCFPNGKCEMLQLVAKT